MDSGFVLGCRGGDGISSLVGRWLVSGIGYGVLQIGVGGGLRLACRWVGTSLGRNDVWVEELVESGR